MDGVFAYLYTPAACLRVWDEDSADFLQSQFSNELRPFTAGQCTYGLWLDVKGKVVADGWVLCEGEEQFRIVSEHCAAETITTKLEKHIIADDVEIESVADVWAIAVVGAAAQTVLQDLIGKLPEPGQFIDIEGGLVFCGRRSERPSYELLFDLEAGALQFRGRLESAGASFISPERIELERMQAGLPSVPAEIGATDLPGEGGFEVDAISFTKGCYLGQEVVARMHNLGKARRALYIVQGDGAVPDFPVPLHHDAGKNIGELRSGVPSPTGWQGVALLKIQHVELGSSVLHLGQTVKISRLLRA